MRTLNARKKRGGWVKRGGNRVASHSCTGLANKRNSVSKRELTETCAKLAEFCEKLGESALTDTHININIRLRGTH